MKHHKKQNFQELKRNKSRRPPFSFTLLELIVGMAILSIMMLLMFQFVMASQKSLEWSDSTWRVYENSRIIFDLIERDCQAMVSSNLNGQQIGYYIGEPAAITDTTDYLYGLYLCFVGSAEPDDNATSRLCEISYKHYEKSTDPYPFEFRRQLITDSDSSNWNFYGQPVNWFVNNNAPFPTISEYQKVAGGIKSLTITCLDQNLNPMTTGESYITLPLRIQVVIVIFDENYKDAPLERRNQTERSFTKIFFLNQSKAIQST